MSKKWISALFLLVFIFFFSFSLAKASLVINEVELYPTKDRFIELYNQDNSDIDLTGWYIQRKTLTGNIFTSLVSKTNLENKKISPSSYFLISRILMKNSDIVLSKLTLTESNIIQIKNSNGKVVDVICWGDISNCNGIKTSNPAEGESIQRDKSGTLIIGTPTPGIQNYISSNPVSQPNGDSGSYGSSSALIQNTNNTKIKTIGIAKIKTKIKSNDFAFIGIPVEFKANTTGYNNEPLLYGKYFWNFGDGDSKEMKVNNKIAFTHTFSYEGEYSVALEYFQNYYSQKSDASDEIIIRVVPANVLISRVGDEKDFFVEISNNTIYDVDLSKWILSSKEKSFIFPRNTILQSNKKIILSPKTTGFSILDKNTLKLSTPHWETVFDYSSSIKPIEPIKNSAKKSVRIKISKLSSSKNSKVVSRVTKLPFSGLGGEIAKSTNFTNNLLAKASGGDIPQKDNFIYWMLVLLLFLGISASASYFIRNNNRVVIPEAEGSNFEIIDE